jgi:hypothetical protein
MYVPGKYLPLLIARRMSPKEALQVINAEAVGQNEQDALAPLIDWLRVAVTRSAADVNSHSTVARSALPAVPIMDADFAAKQKIIVIADLPGWNVTNVSGAAAPGQPGQQSGGLSGGTGTTQTILQSLQLLIQQSQSQGTIQPTRRVKKPSEHWEGTIDLLLRLVGVNAEDELPAIWQAWANCHKKEARTVLQEHLRDNARSLGLPEPVASGELTTMLMSLSFDSMYEDDLETGLQPFVVSYKDQQTIANQQKVNKDYDLVQQGGAAPQLQDIYALKEASKISVPTTEQQMLRTLKAFTVLLYTVLGANNPISVAFRHEVVDQYDSFQPVVETYVASLPGQPIYTQMIRWVQLRCNAYWNAVVRTTTGITRAPDFAVLFNDIQYKQWNRPSIPRKYLADPKPKTAPSSADRSAGGSGGNTGRSSGTNTTAGRGQSSSTGNSDHQRLRNQDFREELRVLGFKLGKVTTFLKKVAPEGENMATPPKMANGAVFCLNWHTKGHCWSHCDNVSSHHHPTDIEVSDLTQFIERGLSSIST